VGAGLDPAHLHAPAGECPQKADGDAGLAGAGARCANDECAGGHCGGSAVRASRIETISPITISAGALKFCRSISASTVASVATRSRSSGVVADIRTAVGVSGERPPSISRRLISPIILTPI